MPFLQIGPVALPIPESGGGSGESPDGPAGKRRWEFTSAPISQALYSSLRTTAGFGSGSESERNRFGVLLSDKPFVACSGNFNGGVAVSCEVTVTNAAYHGEIVNLPGECMTRVVSVLLREA